MKDPCRRWETWIEQPPAGDETERERHLETCSTCREQWSAHLAFAELARVPSPPLAPDLGIRVQRALAELAPESMLSPGRRQVMRLYWLLSTFAAGLILAQLEPTSTAWVVFWLCLAALALGSLPALMLLRRRFSWGLLDLLVWTLR